MEKTELLLTKILSIQKSGLSLVKTISSYLLFEDLYKKIVILIAEGLSCKLQQKYFRSSYLIVEIFDFEFCRNFHL